MTLNTNETISKLPAELLLAVFVQISGDEDADFSDVLYLTHVCQYWRYHALNLPVLWTSHFPGSHLEGLKTVLERSKSLPLRIDMGTLTGDCFRHILSQMHRPQQIDWDLEDGDEIYVRAMFNDTQKTPENSRPLQVLSLWYDDTNWPHSITVHEIPSFPLLRHLEVQNCSIPWSSLPVFPDLRSIRVYGDCGLRVAPLCKFVIDHRGSIEEISVTMAPSLSMEQMTRWPEYYLTFPNLYSAAVRATCRETNVLLQLLGPYVLQSRIDLTKAPSVYPGHMQELLGTIRVTMAPLVSKTSFKTFYLISRPDYFCLGFCEMSSSGFGRRLRAGARFTTCLGFEDRIMNIAFHKQDDEVRRDMTPLFSTFLPRLPDSLDICLSLWSWSSNEDFLLYNSIRTLTRITQLELVGEAGLRLLDLVIAACKTFGAKAGGPEHMHNSPGLRSLRLDGMSFPLKHRDEDELSLEQVASWNQHRSHENLGLRTLVIDGCSGVTKDVVNIFENSGVAVLWDGYENDSDGDSDYHDAGSEDTDDSLEYWSDDGEVTDYFEDIDDVEMPS